MSPLLAYCRKLNPRQLLENIPTPQIMSIPKLDAGAILGLSIVRQVDPRQRITEDALILERSARSLGFRALEFRP